MRRHERARAVLGASVFVALLLSLTGIPGALAGTTGKLSGRVLDQKKQPLTGVNVAIPAARLGAATDADGRFVIIGIPAGTYEVKVSLLGYGPVAVQDVRISADNTTPLEVTLAEAPVLMKEVVVSAERPVVNLKLTSTIATVSREDLKTLPVQELQEVVNLQAGVVDGHFRGGRLGEVQYQVDGVSVNNAYDNKSSLRIDRSLIEEVQVISGTFDAEYGQAMSGVVNAVLRRGTDQFRWDAEVLGGGYVYAGERRSVPDDFHEFRPFGTSSFQGSASGPLGLPRTYYLANARYYATSDYLSAVRRFRATDYSDPASGVYSFLGDGKSEPLGWSREWSGVVKLTNRSLPKVELDYQALFNRQVRQDADWAFRLEPAGMGRQRTFSIAHGLDLTHTLSKTTFYSVSLRHNYFDYRDMAFDDVYDPRYDAAGTPKGYSGYELGAYVQGVDLTRFRQRTSSVVWKNSFVSQVTREQQIKLGAEFEWPHVTFGTPGYLVSTQVNNVPTLVRHVNEPPNYPDPQTFRPYTAAAFAQEDVEWNDLRIRAGVRFEYFNARSMLPGDLANPANTIAGAPTADPVATTRKMSLAPRLGVSYPVTRDAALFFAYGHFYQMPALGDIFTNADYSALRELQSSVVRYGVMGNPDIRPEKTVQYQFGYKQAVTEWLGVDVNVFYKDIRDLLGVEFISTYNDAEYARLTNVDFGNVIGFTVALDQRRRGLLSSSLDYTWQLAQGNASDPRETATRAEAGLDSRPRQVPFTWDQRHTLNLTVVLSRPEDFSISSFVRVASGQPYTPVTANIFGGSVGTNSGRKPPGVVVDLRGEKVLRAGSRRVSLFGRVFNVFDTRYFNGFIFANSGSADYSRYPGADQVQLANPTRYYGPRRVEVGFSLGSRQGG